MGGREGLRSPESVMLSDIFQICASYPGWDILYLTVIGCDTTNPECVNEKVIAERLTDNTCRASFLFNASREKGKGGLVITQAK